jgi:hypothetical protein
VLWADLAADDNMLAAFKAAGVRPLDGDRAAKNNWSNRFADACAVMVADEVRRNPEFGRFEVRPNSDGSGREALTFVGSGDQKRVDVLASTLASGLQLGVSLKGMNFQDAQSGNYDKNLTGRTYELQAEVSAIHGTSPRRSWSASSSCRSAPRGTSRPATVRSPARSLDFAARPAGSTRLSRASS